MKNTKVLLFMALIVIGCTGKKEETSQETKEEVRIEKTQTSKYYELRTYYASEGNLDKLLSRFRDHTTALFEKYGMENVGYWIPTENEENTLVYLLSYESPEKRDEAWKGFVNDPEWKKVFEESRKDGALVDSVKNIFMRKAYFSPDIKADGSAERLFEMRTYYTHPGKLSDLHKRFENHTMDIFASHGMENLIYFELDESQAGADSTLVYLLAHKDLESADASWKAFREDPKWKKAFEESRKEGPLVNKVISKFMKATDFSAIK